LYFVAFNLSRIIQMFPTIVLAPETSKDAASRKEMMGQFGDVFRVDSETMEGTKRMLVNYYDVRSAKVALKNRNGKAFLVPLSNVVNWVVKLSLALLWRWLIHLVF